LLICAKNTLIFRGIYCINLLTYIVGIVQKTTARLGKQMFACCWGAPSENIIADAFFCCEGGEL